MVIAKSKNIKTEMNNSTKTSDQTWNSGPEVPNNQDHGVPRAIFIPHSDSLPFEERYVSLEHAAMIGRSVYRAMPSSNNTIFECRVLSRHHATLYYEKGHFYLKDVNSSNGTFINSNRSISKDKTSIKEPHEVFSGDVVQFGISVVENKSNGDKNTFPPVVAVLKLYHPDGKEAKLAANTSMTTPLHLKDLYQLNNFLQEALQRETSLESRLRTLRECVERTRAEAQASWHLFVGEQRLLMRVYTLENMLSIGKQPDQQHISQLLNDKRNYQEVAVESLRTAHEQRLALEESLERRSREAAALHQYNCTLRLAASNALSELQKLATRCEHKMSAARLAIAAAEDREASVRAHLPLTYSVQNGEAKMLVLSTDSDRAIEDGHTNSSLEEAVRSLPDYIKLLLPQQILTKVGLKSLTPEVKSAKEFQLIINTNNEYESEKREIKETEDGIVSGSGEDNVPEETCPTVDACTDDEKQLRLNNDVLDDDQTIPHDGEIQPDNNANSEPDNRDDTPNKGQFEYANLLRVIAGLNDEIKALRERVVLSDKEAAQLRLIRDEMLAAQADVPDDTLPMDAEDAATYRERIAELQSQLARSTGAEEANMVEIQRLASSAAEMQAELAFRPTYAVVDDLTSQVAQLQSQLYDKQVYIERLQANERPQLHDRATETMVVEDLHEAVKIEMAVPHETNETTKETTEEIDKNISEKIDEMFKLDFDDDDNSDSVTTEIDLINELKDDGNDLLKATDAEPSFVSADFEVVNTSNMEVKDFIRLDDDERLQVTLQNGSLHALEEELVRAKEQWSEVCAERARLAGQLAELQRKTSMPVNVTYILLAVVLPAAFACVYYLLLPYIS